MWCMACWYLNEHMNNRTHEQPNTIENYQVGRWVRFSKIHSTAKLTREGMILTLTGVSGTGKTTIAKALKKRLPTAQLLTSYTTRAKRASDVAGEYAYLDHETFDRMNANGEFLWDIAFTDVKSGTTKKSLRAALEDELKVSIMILVPDVLPKLYAFADKLGKRHAILPVYIPSPSEQTLRKRMRKRGEADIKIEQRIRACRDYDQTVNRSDIPYIWIDNTGELHRAVDAIMGHLESTDHF